MMRLPSLIVNLKNYKQGSGDRVKLFLDYALDLWDLGVGVYVAVPPLDLARYAGDAEYRDIMFSQVFDVVGYGSYTGHIPLERLKDMGIKYSLLNHSEYKMDHGKIRELVDAANEAGVETVVCVDSVEELNKLLSLGVRPKVYAIEPPELIGTGRSVSKYRPETVVEAVKIGSEHGVPVLCGAGVSSRDDVDAAMRLGVVGVLVASAIVKAEDPYVVMKAMAEVLAKHK